jgi:hypothetical protein
MAARQTAEETTLHDLAEIRGFQMEGLPTSHVAVIHQTLERTGC